MKIFKTTFQLCENYKTVAYAEVNYVARFPILTLIGISEIVEIDEETIQVIDELDNTVKQKFN